MDSANMPKNDIVRDNINTHNVMERRPTVYMSMPGMDLMRRGGSNSMKHRRNIKPQKIINAKPTMKAPLKTTENACPSMVMKTNQGPYELKLSLTGLLNKLTAENYERVQPKIKSLIVKNPEYSRIAINVFYYHAIYNPFYSTLYAKVCKSIVENNMSKDKDPAVVKSLLESVTKFKRDLLVKCQNEFERTHQFGAYQVSVDRSLKEIEKCTDEEIKKQMMKAHKERFENKFVEQIDRMKANIQAAHDAHKKKLEEELEYLENKFRKCSICLIIFVGELYKMKLLTLKIILPLFEKFSQNLSHCHNAEALCKLMTTVGAVMWNESKDSEKNTIREVMDRCRDFTKTSIIENRIRFLLLDIIELYDNKFIPKRKSQQTVGPSTKQEVHNEMIMEEENEKITLNNTRSSNMDNRDRQGGRGSMNKESLVSGNTEVWKTVLNSNTSSKNNSWRNLNNRHSDSSGERLVSGNTEVWKTVLNSNTSSKNNSWRNLNNKQSDASGETPRPGPGGSYSASCSGGSLAGETIQQSVRSIDQQDGDWTLLDFPCESVDVLKKDEKSSSKDADYTQSGSAATEQVTLSIDATKKNEFSAYVIVEKDSSL